METMTRILILCTGNSCRSQMAEGLLKSFDDRLVVHSAGTEPSAAVLPLGIQVVAEIGTSTGGPMAAAKAPPELNPNTASRSISIDA